MTAPLRLVRDRLTVALDGTFVTWGWFLYAFSPAVPLLAHEQEISRGVAGLHGTALAVGTVLTGLVSERVARVLGRRRQLLVGTSITSVGVLLLLVGPGLAATLTACVVAAIGGNLTLAAAQTALVEHHGPLGPTAVAEGNGYATTVGLLAPLALGATVGAGLGWRPAIALTIVMALASAVLLLRVPSDGALGKPVQVTHAEGEGAFDPAYWRLWTAMVCGVAIEFVTTFWASDLIRDRTGASASVATAAVAALLAGMTVSRFATGGLSRRWPPEHLLAASYGVAVAGWLVLWSATVPVLAVVGLFVAGVGYGLHYPVAIALVIRAAGARPDRGQAIALLGTGGAVGLAPFLLGAAADVVGPHTAFLLVPVLCVVAAGCVVSVARSRRVVLPAA